MSEENRLERAAGGAGGLGPKTGFSSWIGGRCRRREYWAWVVPIIAGMVALELTGIPFITLLVSIPLLMIWIRRFHDLGRSGWFAPLINVVTNVLGMMLTATAGADIAGITKSLMFFTAVIALGSIPGERRKNAFGHPPGGVRDVAETFS